MIDLRSLEVFYWVVKLGGFGRAAERLHMTQPAVSGRIAQIEACYGHRLLDRSSNRGAIPTAKGDELYVYAERMLALQTQVETMLAAGQNHSGIIRIGVAETLVHTLVGRLIHRLHKTHPGITPEITVAISPSLQSMLLSGEIDIALLLGPVTEPRVRNMPLTEHAMVWVASPSLVPQHTRTDSLADLVHWPILSYERGTLPHAQLTALFSRPDLPAVRIFPSSSLTAIVRMALDGIGIGVVPLDVARSELASGQLRLLDAAPTLPPLRFTASFLDTAATSLAATVAQLASQVAAEP